MPDKKNNQTVDKAALSRKYFNVVDTYSNKIFNNINEQSKDLGLSKDQLTKIYAIINNETVQVKNWGLDQIHTTIK